MVFVTISTSTPISDQRRRSAWRQARRTGPAGSGGRSARRPHGARQAGGAHHLDWPSPWRDAAGAGPGRGRGFPAGSTPVAGRAKRPSAPQTKSWVWASPAIAIAAARVEAGRSRRDERRRSRYSSSASRRGRRAGAARAGRASRSWGSRSRAMSSDPERRPSAIADGDSDARNSMRSRRAPWVGAVTRDCVRGRRGRRVAARRGTGRFRSTAPPGSEPATAIAVRPSVRSDGRIGTGCWRRMTTSRSA